MPTCLNDSAEEWRGVMAIYHFSVKVISRAEGRSAVAAAAYRSASALQDERLGRIHDFTGKDDVIHSEVLLPSGAPERLADRTTLWNEVEATERRKDAQLAREVEFALPRELTPEQSVELARAFVDRQFVSRGMVADLNVHWSIADDGEPKPHAHVMLSMREVGPNGFGSKVREWNATTELTHWREAWAEAANAKLAELGHEARIDHRSFEAQDVVLEPQNKIGPAAKDRDARGLAAERAAEHREIARRNGERIAADPEIALRSITHGQSTFTRRDLARFVHRHSDGAEQFALVMSKVMQSEQLMVVAENPGGEQRYTSWEMAWTERQMEDSARALADDRVHRVERPDIDRALQGAELGAEQRAALAHVMDDRGLALVTGVAGSGKSTMLAAAREAWEASGYNVRGATLSGIAAEGLEAGSGIQSRTLASLEHAWGKGYDQLGPMDVLVIDEAGLVGSRQLERVLSHASRAGAKVVLVGDPEQLQAIEAGAGFRALKDRHGSADITTVQRQRVDWQRDATLELATARTGAALSRYAEAGAILAHESHEQARAALVERWAEAARDGGSSVILAYTRDDVRALNTLAREHGRALGQLGDDIEVMTTRGERRFANGDKVMFLANERGLGVKNGTLGDIEQVSEQRMTVTLAGGGGRVAFDLRDYAEIDHGYAATIHKAQGVTVDRAYVLASEHMDRHAAYVALSRHRDGVELHYGQDVFADRGKLARRLSRVRTKDTTLDYETGSTGRSAAVPQPRNARDERAYHAACNRYLVARQGMEIRTLNGLMANPGEDQEIKAAKQALEKVQPGAVGVVERILERRMVAERAKDRDMGMEL